MTKDKEWLDFKREEVMNQYRRFGNIVTEWDGYKYLRIIYEKDKELRRLKTQLGAKK